MNPDLSNIEKIISYLDDDFEPEEIEEFEKQLFFENSLAEDFLLVKEIEENLKEVNFQEFSQSLRRVHYAFEEYAYVNEHIENEKHILPSQSKQHRLIYQTAAICIAIIGLTFILLNISNKKISHIEKIFSKYYSTYQLNEQYRSVGEQFKYYQNAFDAYSRKDYRMAADYFNKITELNNVVLFYKGITYIECNQLSQAITCFESELKNSNSMFKSQSHWYLALVYLKLNKPSKVRTHLEWLIKNIQYNNYYGRQALLVMADLNKK